MGDTRWLSNFIHGSMSTYKGIFGSWMDTVRLFVMFMLGYVLFVNTPDFEATFQVLVYVLGFQVAASFISHISRKLLFPYVDLRVYFTKAQEEPLASAIVILAFCYLLAVFTETSARFFSF